MSYSAQQELADIYHYVSTHSLEDVIHRKEDKKKGSHIFVRLPFCDTATKRTICSRNRMHDAILL